MKTAALTLIRIKGKLKVIQPPASGHKSDTSRWVLEELSSVDSLFHKRHFKILYTFLWSIWYSLILETGFGGSFLVWQFPRSYYSTQCEKGSMGCNKNTGLEDKGRWFWDERFSLSQQIHFSHSKHFFQYPSSKIQTVPILPLSPFVLEKQWKK